MGSMRPFSFPPLRSPPPNFVARCPPSAPPPPNFVARSPPSAPPPPHIVACSPPSAPPPAHFFSRPPSPCPQGSRRRSRCVRRVLDSLSESSTARCRQNHQHEAPCGCVAIPRSTSFLCAYVVRVAGDLRYFWHPHDGSPQAHPPRPPPCCNDIAVYLCEGWCRGSPCFWRWWRSLCPAPIGRSGGEGRTPSQHSARHLAHAWHGNDARCLCVHPGAGF